MNEIIIGKTDELVMKLLHYFIIEQGYAPIILHGVQNEIWLENLDEDYKIIRIVSSYIHNDEQFKYDLAKTHHVLKKIKKKTFSFELPTLSIFVNLGENVDILEKKTNFQNILCIELSNIEELSKNNFLNSTFPTIIKENNFKEKGAELFMKLTSDINKKSEEEAIKAENVFKVKKPIITYILLFLNLFIFILGRINYTFVEDLFLVNKFSIEGEFYRIITSFFLHYNVLHLLCNAYVLYVIGSQLESFLGRWKYLFIYLISGITGNLLSMAFLGDHVASLGASGAVFGLLGSLLYFGFYYRVYLGNVLRSQIIPLILLNLIIGFIVQGIDNMAHIGGLIGGVLTTVSLGIKYKTSIFEKINGFIVLMIYILFLGYIAFIGL